MTDNFLFICCSLSRIVWALPRLQMFIRGLVCLAAAEVEEEEGGDRRLEGREEEGGPNYFIENSENEDMGLQSYQPESVPRRRGRGRGRGQAANNTPRGYKFNFITFKIL